MPLVVLEAMACGIPVAAMDVGGVAELIEVGATGVLTLPGDCGLMAEVLLPLLARPAQMRAMGQAGRRRVEEHFRLQTSVQRTGEVLRAQAAGGAHVRRHPGETSVVEHLLHGGKGNSHGAAKNGQRRNGRPEPPRRAVGGPAPSDAL